MTEEFLTPIWISLKVTLLSGILVVILGTLAARIFTVKTFKGQTILETLCMMPLVLPPSVVGFLLIVIFGKQSILGELVEWIFKQPVIFTWWAAVIASIVVAFPLMFQSAKNGFLDVDRDIEEAAKVDGAGEWKIFLLITVPLASKALLSGTVLSFARALGEFGATLMFAGNIPGETQTLPTAIYIAIDSGNMQMAWLWVISIMVISFTMLFSLQITQKRHK